MLDYLWKKFKRDNDVAPEAEESSYLNIKGLEQDIKVPAPTKADKRWARKLKNATTGDVTTALISAIETGQNWRVWYLINRPLRTTGNMLLGKIKNLGFQGNVDLAEGLAKAAENDNVTAAYLLLKFAEKKQTTCFGADDVVREEIEHYTRNGLVDIAEKPGSGVFRLVAQTFAALTDNHSVMHRAEQQMLLAQAAIRAAAQGNQAHLDAILDNHLLEPRKFVEAYMHSFYYTDVFGGEKDVTQEERKPFLEWLKRRGIVDEVFEEEAAAVEVRVAGQKAVHRDAVAKGWKLSERWMPNEDGALTPPGSGLVEIDVRDRSNGKPLTFVFNYAAGCAHRLDGAQTCTFGFGQISDTALLDEGRAFLDSCRVATPELVWKKGEPFRLRLKDQKPG
ncbi:MAG: hypothetical protein EPN97_12705 [Alphaproteobacteria bacterium]|nr:MAG: hypothetical protein EPN97_12705 [Alphaproteobacteria bacterium]